MNREEANLKELVLGWVLGLVLGWVLGLVWVLVEELKKRNGRTILLINRGSKKWKD
jgi:hypothetical protein